MTQDVSMCGTVGVEQLDIGTPPPLQFQPDGRRVFVHETGGVGTREEVDVTWPNRPLVDVLEDISGQQDIGMAFLARANLLSGNDGLFVRWRQHHRFQADGAKCALVGIGMVGKIGQNDTSPLVAISRGRSWCREGLLHPGYLDVVRHLINECLQPRDKASLSPMFIEFDKERGFVTNDFFHVFEGKSIGATAEV